LKFIFITGGVASSIGKGITASSIGMLLKARSYEVNMVKIDPYLQIDAGTMSPYEHGEVFVTEDGGETDLDIGNYERFINKNLTKKNNITAGKIYWNILLKERKGEYLGKTVQIIPHVTNEIKSTLFSFGKKSDVVIVEIGGTIGDIESQPFIEAVRQIKKDIGKNNVLYIHVSLLPFLRTSNEIKTKPTQHSVRELRGMGIQPDLLICRSEIPLNEGVKDKLSLFCDVEKQAIIEAHNAKTIYEIPLIFEQQNLGNIITEKLFSERKPPDLTHWKKFVEKVLNPKRFITVGIVGKYTHMKDAYLSIIEALTHAGAVFNSAVKIKWIESENVGIEDPHKIFKDVDGILIPGGFGTRGIEGKIKTVHYARQSNTPFLGICLGLQCAVIEFARNVCKLTKANSTEFDPITPYPVIDILPTQKKVVNKGGTMRVGSYLAILKDGTKTKEIYRTKEVSERHRHRYEVNPEYKDLLEKNGLIVSGESPDGKLVEFIEIPKHKFFIATQSHPEFKSRPTNPSPLFVAFIKACSEL